MFKRSSGVLVHLSSLPSNYGIGDFGPEAYRFVDWLKSAKQSWWQILPLNPVSAYTGASPYSSYSAFALNSLFISPDKMCESGYVSNQDVLNVFELLNSSDWADIIQAKECLCKIAFSQIKNSAGRLQEFADFCEKQSFWLDDYALYVVLKKNYTQSCWINWSSEFVSRDEKSINDVIKQYEDEIVFIKFIQFVCFKQWMALKAYANKNEVSFIGDIPIYVSYDSVDVWAFKRYFQLDPNFNQTVVAGVPPDYFSPDGQKWGNPLYDWEALKQDNYGWWMDRLKWNLELFNTVRIDHFRAFAQYWEVASDEPSAKEGRWVKGPGEGFFNCVKSNFPDMPIIAEDLGIITDDVHQLRDQFDLPGMRILMFAFGKDYQSHSYFPENIIENCVVYPGTHDNNTVKGWFDHDISDVEKWHLCEYLASDISREEVAWEFIRMAAYSKANVAIYSIQDMLALPQEDRMNTPGTVENNWVWRFSKSTLSSQLANDLANLMVDSHRVAQ